jgi:fido (protein-threonine AMPylation protein)
MEGNGRSARVWLDLILKKELKKCVDWSKAPLNFICTQFNAKRNTVDTFKSYLTKVNTNNLLYINEAPVLCIPHPSMWNSNVKNQEEWKEIIAEFIKNVYPSK